MNQVLMQIKMTTCILAVSAAPNMIAAGSEV